MVGSKIPASILVQKILPRRSWCNRWKLCRVCTCRFDNQVPNGKLVWKCFCVVKLTQYICFWRREKACLKRRHEICVLKLENPFLQTPGFVPGRQNR